MIRERRRDDATAKKAREQMAKLQSEMREMTANE
jgi:hypothetical protein